VVRKTSTGAFSRNRITRLEHQITFLWFKRADADPGPTRVMSLAGVVAEELPRPYRDGLTSSVSTFGAVLSRGADPRPRCSEDHNEAAVSAQRAQTGKEARISFAHEHPWRTRRSPVSPPEGARSAVGVIDRLSGPAAFARLRAEGRRSGKGPIRLVSRLDPTQPPRIAFAIPRKVGNAVRRNRVRRRIRAVLCELARETPGLLPPGDHLIRVTAPIDDWSHATLRTTMYSLLTSVTESADSPSPRS
jgi:ribonuclease P protein component